MRFVGWLGLQYMRLRVFLSPGGGVVTIPLWMQPHIFAAMDRAGQR
jgi:hypothetical protein